MCVIFLLLYECHIACQELWRGFYTEYSRLFINRIIFDYVDIMLNVTVLFRLV